MHPHATMAHAYACVTCSCHAGLLSLRPHITGTILHIDTHIASSLSTLTHDGCMSLLCDDVGVVNVCMLDSVRGMDVRMVKAVEGEVSACDASVPHDGMRGCHARASIWMCMLHVACSMSSHATITYPCHTHHVMSYVCASCDGM